MSYVSGEIHTR